jgi:hypothetical protein
VIEPRGRLQKATGRGLREVERRSKGGNSEDGRGGKRECKIVK